MVANRAPWFALAGLVAGALVLAPPAASQDDPPADELTAPPPGASATARLRWLRERIEALIAARPALADARIGIAIRDLAATADARTNPDGKLEPAPLLYARDADGAYNVASNTKLATAAAALALLGPEFRWRTAAFVDRIGPDGAVRGDLHVRGTGDPSFGTAQLAALADAIARAGVTRVRAIRIDDGYFDDQVMPPKFDEQPDEQAAFRAPVAALALSFSAFSIYVRPNLAGEGPAAITVVPPSDYVRLSDSAVITQRTGRNRIRIATEQREDHVELRVTGQLRAGTSTRRYRRRAADPVKFFGAALRRALIDRGVRVRRADIRRGPVPDDARRLAVIESEPLSVLVDGLGKFSNNHVAETLLKTIGAETEARGRPATWDDGLRAIRAFLTDRVGLEGAYRFDNGSGLFDASRFSPRQIVTLLAAAHRDPEWGPDFVASLSIAGADGTLRRRMAGTAAERRVRAKTGTLATVSALGGYAAARADRPVAFALLIEGFPDARSASREARALQDDIAAALVGYLRDAP